MLLPHTSYRLVPANGANDDGGGVRLAVWTYNWSFTDLAVMSNLTLNSDV